MGETLILELCKPYFKYMDSYFKPSDDADIQSGEFTMYMLLK